MSGLSAFPVMAVNAGREHECHFWTPVSGVTVIFGPPANICYSLITVLIHNSGHFGPPLQFWAPWPPALPGLPMAS